MGKFKVLQKGPQREYVPSSGSDLYNSDYLIPTNKHPSNKSYIQKEESFNGFNPNKCGMETNLGGNLFFNHTRQQTKNLKLK